MLNAKYVFEGATYPVSLFVIPQKGDRVYYAQAKQNIIWEVRDVLHFNEYAARTHTVTILVERAFVDRVLNDWYIGLVT